MVVYLFVITALLLFSANIGERVVNIQGERKYTLLGNIQIFLCATVLIFISGFRWKVGTDFSTYITAYERWKESWKLAIVTFDEPGTAIVSKIASLIYDSPVSFFVLMAFITIILYVLTIKKYCDIFQMGIVLYVFIGSWHGAFNGMRQYLAAAIIFAGHRYIFEKKFWKYFLIIAIASCFHITALVMLPVYFLVNKKISFKRIVLITGVVLVIRYSYDYLFAIMSFIKENDQTQYAYMMREVNAIRIMVTFAPLLIALLCKNTTAFKDEETQFYVMLMVVNAGFMLGTSGSAYLARVGIYTECFGTLAIPRLVNCFEKRSKRIMILLICSLYFMFWFYELYARRLFNFQWSFGQI